MRLTATATAAIAMTGLLATPARADDETFVAKKDARLAEKAERPPADPAARQAWQRELDARIGKPPARVINLYNTWNQEYLPIDADGPIDVPQHLQNYFFRCHFTHEPTDMDPRLLGVVVDAARKFDADRVNVISGFRAPKYNLILQKKGREVSRDSQHTHGKAVDFRIPGVPIERVHRWVRHLRLGGVGFYRHSRFVHADTARIRYWTGR